MTSTTKETSSPMNEEFFENNEGSNNNGSDGGILDTNEQLISNNEHLQQALEGFKNISNLVDESRQVRCDAFRLFQHYLMQMNGVKEETEAKLEAFRNLMAAIGPAVGLTPK